MQTVERPHIAQYTTARAQVLLCLALGLASLAAYWPVLQADFLNYDDPRYVTENSMVGSGLVLENIYRAFTSFHAANWHPLTWMSHMLDCQLFGLRPAGHHAVNLLFHIANSMLLFRLFQQMTRALWRSAFVAALFALHPLHVESVAWIAERKDVLSTFFGLLALGAYVRYVQSEVQSPSLEVHNAKARVQRLEFKPQSVESLDRGSPITRHASRFTFHVSPLYLLSLFFFACSLLSKPMLVTLPFLLLLLDFWPLSRVSLFPKFNIQNSKFIIAEKLPFLAFSAGSCVITFLAQRSAGALAGVAGLGLTPRLENAALSYLRYAGRMFWPSGLAPFYPYVRWPVWEATCAGLALFLATILALKLASRRPWLMVGWFWYLGTLVPVIGLVQVGMQSLADRYTYLPLVGLFVIVTWEASELLARRAVRPLARALAGLCVLGGLGAATFHQVRFWQNSVVLFRHTLAVTTENALAHNNLGDAIAKQNPGEAGMHYQAALAIGPRSELTLGNLGNLLYNAGKTAQAREMYLAALRLKPGFAAAHCKLALIATGESQYAEAIAHWRKALESEPDWAEFSNNLAWALATSPDPACRNGIEAVQLAERACRLTPSSASFLDTLAAAYAEAGRFQDAVATVRKAMTMAEIASQTNAVAKFRSRLSLYQAGKPLHQNP